VVPKFPVFLVSPLRQSIVWSAKKKCRSVKSTSKYLLHQRYKLHPKSAGKIIRDGKKLILPDVKMA